MNDSDKTVFLTGASGLLGRAVYAKFKSEGWKVVGTALTRASGDLLKVDITNEEEIRGAIQNSNPKFIIHCAAQRFPDKVDKNPAEALLLNVKATKHITSAAAHLNIPVLYISTDYVFDGKNAPYLISSRPNPVNLYGKTKLDGELVAQHESKDNLILRIPVLYGPVKSLSESAVTSLLQNLLDKEKPISVSNYEKRRPSHVNDIAFICYQLASQKLKNPNLNGIFQWSGEEVLTKYQMIQAMSEVFNLNMDHITPDDSSGGSNSTIRPYDVTLDTSKLKSLNIQHHTIFKEGIKKDLAPWVE